MRAAFLSSARDSRVERVPFDHPRPYRFRHGIARLYWIIDDDQVATKAGQGPVDGGGNPLAALGGGDLAIGIALEPHCREAGLIDRMIDNPAKVIGMGARQKVGVRHHNHALRRITAKKPGRQSHRGTERFQVPGWQGDDQTTDLARSHL